ncbi:MAG TPA: hypothetical protein VD902_15475 [Symbiobacteriaceae bacterium]|nr:hypothetical protein [Symbiobacteriaceae bacterium]
MAKKDPRFPLSEDLIAAAAEAAGDEALNAATGAVPAQPKILVNSRTRRVRKRSQKPAGGWLISPGTWEMFKAGEWLLQDMAQIKFMGNGQVIKVRAMMYADQTRLYIVPVDEQDPDGIVVRRYGSKTSINLGAFLLEANMALPVGVREQFDLIADEKSPFGPAVYFDLNKPLDRRQSKPKKA